MTTGRGVRWVILTSYLFMSRLHGASSKAGEHRVIYSHQVDVNSCAKENKRGRCCAKLPSYCDDWQPRAELTVMIAAGEPGEPCMQAKPTAKTRHFAQATTSLQRDGSSDWAAASSPEERIHTHHLPLAE